MSLLRIISSWLNNLHTNPPGKILKTVFYDITLLVGTLVRNFGFYSGFRGGPYALYTCPTLAQRLRRYGGWGLWSWLGSDNE